MLEPNGQVHAAAALFPLMSADDLNDLAEDIKSHGLLQPIVLDADGTLIDGRNRLAACATAGVKPRFAKLNGHDPTAYILASNVLRRHLTQGQRAMVVAKSTNLVNSHDWGDRTEVARTTGVPNWRITQALMILQYAEEQTNSVISGAVTFDAAFRIAQARQEEDRALKRQAEEQRQQLALLQERARDLAELVVEERMPLEEAMGAFNVRHHEELEREQDALLSRQRMTANFVEAVVMIDGILLSDPGRIVQQWETSGMGLVSSGEGKRHLWTAEGLRNVAQRLMVLADTADLEKGGNLG